MSFDVVVTCFFIDTAVDVVDYIDVIAHVLKEGGLWLNAGPLHYHSKQSVPYSHSQLVEIVRQSGFDVVSRTVIPSTSYCGEEGLSMRTEYYDVPLDVFRLAPHIDTPGSHAVSAPKITANDGIIWRRPDLKLP
jgi:carnosine N-methyltransferase